MIPFLSVSPSHICIFESCDQAKPAFQFLLVLLIRTLTSSSYAHNFSEDRKFCPLLTDCLCLMNNVLYSASLPQRGPVTFVCRDSIPFLYCIFEEKCIYTLLLQSHCRRFRRVTCRTDVDVGDERFSQSIPTAWQYMCLISLTSS